jgi:hypothetical protein
MVFALSAAPLVIGEVIKLGIRLGTARATA